MPSKCDRCGVETNLDGTFFKVRKSFSRSIQTFCPTCQLKRQHSAAKRISLLNLGYGVLGLLLWLVLPGSGVENVFGNLFLFYLGLVLTIMPHELGHASMARLLGMRVFKIYIGSGKTWFSFKLFGLEFEFRPVPSGGLVVAAHRTLQWMRLKQFAFILAGPAVNILMIAAIWPFLRQDQLWSIRPMERGWQPELMFFYANLVVLLENLWPHNLATIFGPLPNDGKQLLNAFFLSREKRELKHAMNFVMEAATCYQQGKYEGAQNWVGQGLALYPDNETLLNLRGVIALELGEYAKAREGFLQLLRHDRLKPLLRALTLNNIAYSEVLLGGEDLLEEADARSQEAMSAMSWVPAIRGTRGTVLVAMGRFEEGLPLLHESMSEATIPSHKAQNACLIAEAECRRGNLSTAQTYINEARKLEPKCLLISRAESALREATAPGAAVASELP